MTVRTLERKSFNLGTSVSSDSVKWFDSAASFLDGRVASLERRQTSGVYSRHTVWSVVMDGVLENRFILPPSTL